MRRVSVCDVHAMRVASKTEQGYGTRLPAQLGCSIMREDNKVTYILRREALRKVSLSK